MNRRIAIKQLGFITAGVALLPGCAKEVARPASIALKNIQISGGQEAMLAEVAETLIPAADMPGAKAMNVHQFVLRMVDDCQPAESQKDFENGLDEFEQAVEKKFDKSFEALPKETNFVALSKDKKDAWGMPLLQVNVDYDDNDDKMTRDFIEQFTDMFEKAGFINIQHSDGRQAPGLDIHEMGGIRMGKDPETSMLNKWHQLHACKNVFVTDGSSMTSTSTQNPSLTYMAFAARAVDFAVKEMKKGTV